MKKFLQFLIWALIAGFVVGALGTLFEMWSNITSSLDTTEGEFTGSLSMVPREQLGYPSLNGTYNTNGTILALLGNGNHYMLVFTAASDLSALAIRSNSDSSTAVINGSPIYWDTSVTYRISGRQSRYSGYIPLGRQDAQGRDLYDKDTYTVYY